MDYFNNIETFVSSPAKNHGCITHPSSGTDTPVRQRIEVLDNALQK